MVAGKPKCVKGVKKDEITVINYEDSTIDTILPERHVFMGSTYFYGKIVSMFGSDLLKGKKGTNKIMQYMMLSEMIKGGSGTTGNMSAMMPFMLMNGGMGNMFEDIFDFGEEDEEVEEKEEE